MSFQLSLVVVILLWLWWLFGFHENFDGFRNSIGNDGIFVMVVVVVVVVVVSIVHHDDNVSCFLIDMDRPCGCFLFGNLDRLFPFLNDHLMSFLLMLVRGSVMRHGTFENQQGPIIEYQKGLKKVAEPGGKYTQTPFHGLRDNSGRGGSHGQSDGGQGNPCRGSQCGTYGCQGKARNVS